MRCNSFPAFPATSLLCLALLVDSGLAVNVSWISPSDGDTYGSGDTIVGQWSADKTVISPSFKLCVISDGAQKRSEDNDNLSGYSKAADDGQNICGTSVWPTIEQSDTDGSYMIHMSLPNVTSTTQCYLNMVDDFGDSYASPMFSFRTSADNDEDDTSTNTEAASASNNNGDGANANNDDNGAGANNGGDEAGASNDVQNSPTSSSIHTTFPASASYTSNPGIQTSGSPQTLPSLESHMPAPTAAYAVPLSLVASVLLAAGGMSVYQRRKLRAERLHEQETLKSREGLSRHSTLSYAGVVALGRGSGPSSQAQSRSTSVSSMRAWQRDVSHYEGHGRRYHGTKGTQFGDADAETYVARTEDTRSVASSSSRGHALHVHEPRRMTREPYYTSGSQARRTTMPAGVFRAGVSPVVPQSRNDPRGADGRGQPVRRQYTLDDEEKWGRLTKVVDTPADDCPRRGDYLNASINDAVVSRYVDVSPIPHSSMPGERLLHNEAVPVSRPGQLHVRRHAEADFEKTSPPSPGHSEEDLYTTVARKLSSRP